MKKKLSWNALGLEGKTRLLLKTINTEKKKLPPENTRTFKKLQGFIDELEYMLQKIEEIRTDLIPNLERILRMKFPTPELVMMALARPSVKNTYDEIKVYLENNSIECLKEDEYKELASIGEAANVLALLGDAVLDLSVIHSLWDSSLSTVGKLSRKREDLVSNKNLAKKCDEWKLFDYRVKRKYTSSEEETKEERINHEKGTLVEAIFGVLYLELGIEESYRFTPLIQ